MGHEKRNRRRAAAVRLPVPVGDRRGAGFARVVVADRIELTVGRPYVLARCAIAASILETVVPLTTLHTSLTLRGSRRIA